MCVCRLFPVGDQTIGVPERNAQHRRQKTRLAVEQAGGAILAWDRPRSAVDHLDDILSAALDVLQYLCSVY